MMQSLYVAADEGGNALHIAERRASRLCLRQRMHRDACSMWMSLATPCGWQGVLSAPRSIRPAGLRSAGNVAGRPDGGRDTGA